MSVEEHFPTTVLKKVKRNDGVGRWPAYIYSHDSCGLWLYSPAGSIYRARKGDKIVDLQVGQGNRSAGLPVIQLIPLTGWWTATWTSESNEGWISVDICTPPTFMRGEWTYTDLELDPHRFADGRVETLDIEEFEASCKAGVIAPQERAEAIRTVMVLEHLLRRHVEPFGRLGWQRLEAASASPLKAITALE